MCFVPPPRSTKEPFYSKKELGGELLAPCSRERTGSCPTRSTDRDTLVFFLRTYWRFWGLVGIF